MGEKTHIQHVLGDFTARRRAEPSCLARLLIQPGEQIALVGSITVSFQQEPPG